jgi:hypothetical protein
VIEAKNVGRWMAGGWGEEEATTRPSTTSRRCIGTMGVAIRSGSPGTSGNLVPAIAGEAPRKFEVKFDAELYAGLVEVAAKFVRDHLSTGKPPDGDARCRRPSTSAPLREARREPARGDA